MDAEIIYEKKYPRVDLLEELAKATAGAAGKPPALPFKKFCEKIMEDTVYVPIPERITSCAAFIQAAVEVSERYELDTTITRHESHITVDYFLSCCNCIHGLKHVFGMADEFAFSKDINGWDIKISMDYYTHAVVRRGRIVAPEME